MVLDYPQQPGKFPQKDSAMPATDYLTVRAYSTKNFTVHPLSTDTFAVFVQEVAGKFLAKGYKGKQSKPCFYYSFKTKEKAEEFVRTEVEAHAKQEQAAAARKAEEKTKRAAFDAREHYKPGDVVHHSWGYDQTNCDFYVVLAIPAKCTLELCSIGSKEVEATGPMSCYVMPDPARVLAGPVRVRVTLYGIGLEHGHAKKWDGNKKYSSWYA